MLSRRFIASSQHASQTGTKPRPLAVEDVAAAAAVAVQAAHDDDGAAERPISDVSFSSLFPNAIKVAGLKHISDNVLGSAWSAMSGQICCNYVLS
jgi:hypothetical protein